MGVVVTSTEIFILNSNKKTSECYNKCVLKEEECFEKDMYYFAVLIVEYVKENLSLGQI